MPFIDDLSAEVEKSRHYKVGERIKLLKEHPELRIRIDTQPLKRIIDYTAFKCISNCSIAADTAIKDSDIDGGMVISGDEVKPEQRLAFVSELRRQGFSAYDISEYEKVKRELEDFRDQATPETLYQLVENKVKAETALIRFFSKDQIKDFEKIGFPDETTRKVYNLGYSIAV